MRAQLYQVNVMDVVAGHEVPIGPAMDNPEALYPLVEKVNLAILKGALTGWQEAHVVRVE